MNYDHLKEWEGTVDKAIEEVISNKVKNPAATHYELWNGFESIDVIKAVLTPEEYRGFLKGNVLKYQLRLGKKDDVTKEMVKIKDYKRELDESPTSPSK